MAFKPKPGDMLVSYSMEKDDITHILDKQLEQAFTKQQSGEIDAAIALFIDLLAQHPNQQDALHGLGMAYAQQRNFKKAVEYLERAVKQAPRIAEFHNNLGNAYQAVGKMDAALLHYHEALRLKSPYSQAHNNLGTLLYRLGKYEEAASHFQKAIRMDPAALDAHYNLANCYIELDRLLDAISHYQEVLKLRPDHLGALHNLGITLCGLKRFNEALPLLEQVIQREAGNLDALFHLGIIYDALGRNQEAIDTYLQIIKRDPKHAGAHHNLATKYLQLNQRTEALTTFQEAYRLQPQNKTAQHMIDALQGKIQEQGAPIEFTRALFNQYAYNYDQHVKQHLQYRVPYLLREAIAPFIPQAQHAWEILDLGCGTGLCAPLFADVAEKMIGVDLSENMLEVANAHGGYYKLYCTDLLSYLAKPDKFDLIICADVLIYFANLQEVFAGCYSALKNKGLFCFSIETLTDAEVQLSPDHPDYQLRKTGRYAHHSQYIQALCAQNHFTIEIEKTEIIRLQEDLPLQGNIYVLRKS